MMMLANREEEPESRLKFLQTNKEQQQQATEFSIVICKKKISQ